MGTALMPPLGVETPLLIQDGGSVLSLNQRSSGPEVFFSLQGDLSFKTEAVLLECWRCQERSFLSRVSLSLSEQRWLIFF